jgi:putative membrane protein
MLLDAGLALLHFVFVFVLVGAIAAEAFVLRLKIDAPVVALLTRIDRLYGISSVLLIAAGVARVIWGAKGGDYYLHSHAFWGKMAMFLIIGLISIIPTMKFIAWSRQAKADASFIAPDTEVRAMRRWVLIEAHLLAVVVLFAVLMARGIG